MQVLQTLRPSRPSGPDGLWLELAGPRAGSRQPMEAFIRRVYAHAYGARITRFMPQLLALRSGRDGIDAVVGLRRAADAGLFLEAYLGERVERCIAAAAGTAVARPGVVELGNLAAARPGSLRRLILALTAMLSHTGAEWVAFTGVPSVRNAFTRLGVELIELGPAERHRLGPGDGHWGSYYDAGPVVFAARVEQGLTALQAALGLEAAVSLTWALWERALVASPRRLPRRRGSGPVAAASCGHARAARS
jgi:hypothetical protein